MVCSIIMRRQAGITSKASAFLVFSVFCAMLAAAYLLTAASDNGPRRSQDRFFTANSVELSGFEGNMKKWTVKARDISSTRNQEVVRMDGVRSGTIFDGQDVIADRIVAETVYVANFRNELEAIGSPEITARADLRRLAGGNRDKSIELSDIRAARVTYFGRQNRTEVLGLFSRDKNTSIKAEKAVIDHRTGKALLTGDPVLRTKESAVRSASFEVSIREDTLKSERRAEIIVDRNGRSSITGERLIFNFKSETGSIEGKVRFSQAGKSASASNLIFDIRSDTAELREDVNATFVKARSILKDPSSARIKGEEARKSLDKGVSLSCDRLLVSLSGKDAKAAGDVRVWQNDRYAMSSRAEYDPKREIITLSGNVSLKKNREWLKTERVVVSVNDGTFQAIGNVEMDLRIKRNKKSPSP